MSERRILEIEIPAMDKMVTALNTLTHDEAERVMRWLNSYHTDRRVRRIRIAYLLRDLFASMGKAGADIR